MKIFPRSCMHIGRFNDRYKIPLISVEDSIWNPMAASICMVNPTALLAPNIETLHEDRLSIFQGFFISNCTFYFIF